MLFEPYLRKLTSNHFVDKDYATFDGYNTGEIVHHNLTGKDGKCVLVGLIVVNVWGCKGENTPKFDATVLRVETSAWKCLHGNVLYPGMVCDYHRTEKENLDR